MQRAQNGECQEHPLKKNLVHPVQQKTSPDNPQRNQRSERGVKRQRWAGYETEVKAEGSLEEIHDQEKIAPVATNSSLGKSP